MIGLAELGPRPPPPGEWVKQLAAAFRVAASGGGGGGGDSSSGARVRPRSGREVLALVRAAARLEPDEELPRGLWMQGILEEVAGGWGVRLGLDA